MIPLALKNYFEVNHPFVQQRLSLFAKKNNNAYCNLIKIFFEISKTIVLKVIAIKHFHMCFYQQRLAESEKTDSLSAPALKSKTAVLTPKPVYRQTFNPNPLQL